MSTVLSSNAFWWQHAFYLCSIAVLLGGMAFWSLSKRLISARQFYLLSLSGMVSALGQAFILTKIMIVSNLHSVTLFALTTLALVGALLVLVARWNDQLSARTGIALYLLGMVVYPGCLTLLALWSYDVRQLSH